MEPSETTRRILTNTNRMPHSPRACAEGELARTRKVGLRASAHVGFVCVPSRMAWAKPNHTCQGARLPKPASPAQVIRAP